MSTAKMDADSTSTGDVSHSKKRKKYDDSRHSKKSRKLNKKDKENTGEHEENHDLDLDIPLLPLSSYLKERSEMVEQIFHCVSGASLHRSLPDVLKGMALAELKARCLQQLEVMSRKRIRRILQGDDPAEISSSGTEDESDVENGESAKTKGKDEEQDTSVSDKNDKDESTEKMDTSNKEVTDADKTENNSDKTTTDKTNKDDVKSNKVDLPKNGDANNENKDSAPPTKMEILELEMRARAIKAMLNSQLGGVDGDSDGNSGGEGRDGGKKPEHDEVKKGDKGKEGEEESKSVDKKQPDKRESSKLESPVDEKKADKEKTVVEESKEDKNVKKLDSKENKKETSSLKENKKDASSSSIDNSVKEQNNKKSKDASTSSRRDSYNDEKEYSHSSDDSYRREKRRRKNSSYSTDDSYQHQRRSRHDSYSSGNDSYRERRRRSRSDSYSSDDSVKERRRRSDKGSSSFKDRKGGTVIESWTSGVEKIKVDREKSRNVLSSEGFKQRSKKSKSLRERKDSSDRDYDVSDDSRDGYRRDERDYDNGDYDAYKYRRDGRREKRTVEVKDEVKKVKKVKVKKVKVPKEKVEGGDSSMEEGEIKDDSESESETESEPDDGTVADVSVVLNEVVDKISGSFSEEVNDVVDRSGDDVASDVENEVNGVVNDLLQSVHLNLLESKVTVSFPLISETTHESRSQTTDTELPFSLENQNQSSDQMISDDRTVSISSENKPVIKPRRRVTICSDNDDPVTNTSEDTIPVTLDNETAPTISPDKFPAFSITRSVSASDTMISERDKHIDARMMQTMTEQDEVVKSTEIETCIADSSLNNSAEERRVFIDAEESDESEESEEDDAVLENMTNKSDSGSSFFDEVENNDTSIYVDAEIDCPTPENSDDPNSKGKSVVVYAFGVKASKKQGVDSSLDGNDQMETDASELNREDSTNVGGNAPKRDSKTASVSPRYRKLLHDNLTPYSGSSNDENSRSDTERKLRKSSRKITVSSPRISTDEDDEIVKSEQTKEKVKSGEAYIVDVGYASPKSIQSEHSQGFHEQLERVRSELNVDDDVSSDGTVIVDLDEYREKYMDCDDIEPNGVDISEISEIIHKDDEKLEFVDSVSGMEISERDISPDDINQDKRVIAPEATEQCATVSEQKCDDQVQQHPFVSIVDVNQEHICESNRAERNIKCDENSSSSEKTIDNDFDENSPSYQNFDHPISELDRPDHIIQQPISEMEQPTADPQPLITDRRHVCNVERPISELEQPIPDDRTVAEVGVLELDDCEDIDDIPGPTRSRSDSSSDDDSSSDTG